MRDAIKESVGRGSADIKGELQSIGDSMAEDIKRAMHDFSTPANAPATIRKKGEDNPWIHTEQTVEAVEARVRDTGLKLTKDKLGRVRMRDSRGRFA